MRSIHSDNIVVPHGRYIPTTSWFHMDIVVPHAWPKMFGIMWVVCRRREVLVRSRLSAVSPEVGLTGNGVNLLRRH